MKFGEAIAHGVTDRLRPLTQTALLIGAVAVLFNTTDEPIERAFDSVILDRAVEPALHHYGWTGWWEDDNPEHLAPAANVGAGKVQLDEYLGSFTTYVTAEARLNGKIFGETFDTSKSVREGYIVNRLKLKGVSIADVRTTQEAMYITQYSEGVDTGIDLTTAVFEMQNPDLADDVNGALQCEKGPEDEGFTGCVTKDTIRQGFWSAFPVIGEDQDGDIYNAAELLFDEYGRIEECHFDTILIPALNEAYKKYSDKGINFVIDGPNRYQIAMEILVRGFWRDSIKESRPPQAVIFNLNGNYVPELDINTRLQQLDDTVDFPFAPPKNFDPTYCAQGPGGTIPLGLTNTSLDSFSQQIENIAIMGLPQVPDGYNPFTRQFDDTDTFKAPPQSVFNELRGS
jgi:hypothetical protein